MSKGVRSNAASKDWLMKQDEESLRRLALFYDLSTIQGILIQMEIRRRQESDTRMLPALV